MIRTKHNGLYHTIASACEDNAETIGRVDLDCGNSLWQPVTITTEPPPPDQVCPACDEVRQRAVEYFATQVEARAG